MLLWLLLLVGIVSGATLCDSCESCSNITGDVILTQDIVATSDICIWVKASKLDCNGHRIITNSSTIALYVVQDDVEIDNCHIEGFQYGIYVNKSDDVYLYNNDLEANQYGIYGVSSTLYAYSNVVCFNNESDFYSPTGWGTSNGTENQCDLSGNWSDYGFPNECTYYCSLNDTQAPVVELISPNYTISFQPTNYTFKAIDDQASLIKCAVIVEGFNLGDYVVLNNTPYTASPIYYYASFSPTWKVICKDRNKNRGESATETLDVEPSVCECYDEITCQQALWSDSCAIVRMNNSITLSTYLNIPSNKVLDCNSYEIDAGYDRKLNISNVSNVTIQNCTFDYYLPIYRYNRYWYNLTFQNLFFNTTSQPLLYVANYTDGFVLQNVNNIKIRSSVSYPLAFKNIYINNVTNIILYFHLSYIHENNISQKVFYNATIANASVENFSLIKEASGYSNTFESLHSSIRFINSSVSRLFLYLEEYWAYSVLYNHYVNISFINSSLEDELIYNVTTVFFPRYSYVRRATPNYEFWAENSTLRGNLILYRINTTYLHNSNISGNLSYVNATLIEEVNVPATVVFNNSYFSSGVLYSAVPITLVNTTVVNSTWNFPGGAIIGSRFFNNTQGITFFNLTEFRDNVLCDNTEFDIYAPFYTEMLEVKPTNNTCNNFYYNDSFFFDIGHFGCAHSCNNVSLPSILLIPITDNITLPVNATFNISADAPAYLCGVVINNYTEAIGIAWNGTFNVISAFDPANVLQDTGNLMWVECYNQSKHYSNNVSFNVSVGDCYCDGANCKDALESRYCNEVYLTADVANLSFSDLRATNTFFACEGHYLENVSFEFDKIGNFTLKDCNFENSTRVFDLPTIFENVTFYNLTFRNIEEGIRLKLALYINHTLFKDIAAYNVTYFYIKHTNRSSALAISLDNITVNYSKIAFQDNSSNPDYLIYRLNYYNITVDNAHIAFAATGESFRFYNILITNVFQGFVGRELDNDVNFRDVKIKNATEGFNYTRMRPYVRNLSITNSSYGIIANSTSFYLYSSLIENNTYGLWINPHIYTYYDVVLRFADNSFCNREKDITVILSRRDLVYHGYRNNCSKFDYINDFHHFGCTNGCAEPLYNVTINITFPQNDTIINVIPLPVNISLIGPVGNYSCGIVVNSSYWDWEVAWQGTLTPGDYTINLSSPEFNLQNQIRMECYYQDAKYYSNNVTFNISDAVCYCYDTGTCTDNMNAPICRKVVLATNATHNTTYAFINVTTDINKTFDCNNNWVLSNYTYSFVNIEYPRHAALNISNCHFVNFSAITRGYFVANESFIENITFIPSLYSSQVLANHRNNLFYNRSARFFAYLYPRTNSFSYQVTNITLQNITPLRSYYDSRWEIRYMFSDPSFYYVPSGDAYLEGLNISDIVIDVSNISHLFLVYESAGVSFRDRNLTLLPVEIHNILVNNSSIGLFFYGRNTSYRAPSWGINYSYFLLENASIDSIETGFDVDQIPTYLIIKDFYLANSNSSFKNTIVNMTNVTLWGGVNVSRFENMQVIFGNASLCGGEQFDLVWINTSFTILNLTTTWSNPYIQPTQYCKPLSNASLQLLYPANNSHVYLYPPYDFMLSVNATSDLTKCGIYLNNQSIYLTSNLSFPANISPGTYPTGNLQGLLLCEDSNNTYELWFNITFNKECICDSYETCNQAYLSPDCETIYINRSDWELNQTLFNYTNMTPKTISCMGNTIKNNTFFEFAAVYNSWDAIGLNLTIKDCVFENMPQVLKIADPESIYSRYKNNSIRFENVTVKDSYAAVRSYTRSYDPYLALYFAGMNCSNVTYCVQLTNFAANLTINDSHFEGGITAFYVNHSNAYLSNVSIVGMLYAGILFDDSYVAIYDSNLSSNARGTYLINGSSYFYNSSFCSNTVQDICITDVDSLNHIGRENQCDSPGGTGYYDDLDAYGCTYLCPTGPNHPPENEVLSPLNNHTYYGANLTITFNITDVDNLFPNNTLRVYMDLSGNSPIYFNDSYVAGTLATFIYSNPTALPGLYYLTIYARDRYKAESLDVIAFYWYPNACYCGSCEECSAMLANDSCTRVVINQSFNATQPVCLENVSKPLIGQGYEITGTGGIGIQAFAGAYIFNLSLTGFEIAINGTGNITIENVSLTNNDNGVLLNGSLFLNATNNYICYNDFDVILDQPLFVSENNTCQKAINFNCTRACIIPDDDDDDEEEETEPVVNETNVTQNITLNETTTNTTEQETTQEESEEETVGETISPAIEDTPTEEVAPPAQEEPAVVEEHTEPASAPATEEEPTPPQEHPQIQSQSTQSATRFWMLPSYYYVGIIGLLLFFILLARIARYRILQTQKGYYVIVTNLLNKPLANKTIEIDGKKMKLDSNGGVVLPTLPQKLKMPYRILLKK